MVRCIIFCAGGFDGLALPVEPGDLVIAADGGLRHARAAGAAPDILLGDFDSLGFVPPGAEVFPVEKDDTDAMLAVRRGLEHGCREFILYGSLDGRRLDHTVANFQTLRFLSEHGAAGWLVGQDYLVTAAMGESLLFSPDARGVLSVFCMGPDARGVTLQNLRYPLKNASLTGGFPLGVSNHFTGAPAEVSVREGCILVMWDRKNGFPQRRPCHE